MARFYDEVCMGIPPDDQIVQDLLYQNRETFEWWRVGDVKRAVVKITVVQKKRV